MVKGLIAKGAQGLVYRGYDERLQRDVAIKLLPFFLHTGGRNALLAEARAVAAVRHSAVVGIYDVLTVGHHIALVQEHVPGCNLAQMLGVVDFSLADSLSITLDIASALGAVHSANIIHRDLKPSNVLVGTDGLAKLVDFGIASKIGVQKNNDRRGSLVCVSPEQYLGEPVTVQTDLFALGVLLYQLLCHEHPFYVDGELCAKRLLEANYHPFEHRGDVCTELPMALCELIDHLLQRQPNLRPSTTLEVRQRILGVLHALPLSTRNTLSREAKSVSAHQSPLEAVPLPCDLGLACTLLPYQYAIFREHWGKLSLLKRALIVCFLSIIGLLCALWQADYFQSSSILVEVGDIYFDPGVNSNAVLDQNWIEKHVIDALQKINPDYDAVRGQVARHRLIVDQNTRIQSESLLYKGAVTVDVRCKNSLCLLSINRTSAVRARSVQWLLFASDPESVWKNAIEQLIGQLYSELP